MDLQAQKYDEWLRKLLAEDRKPAGYYELLRKAEYHYRRYDTLHLKADRLLAGTGRAYESMQDEDREHVRELYKREIDEMEVRAAKLYKQAEAAFDKYLALRGQADAMLGEGQSAEQV